ncbi:LacI family DNA-binding transcriptional regulator [Palleronia sp. LCG004]|uniref:LacI family DNA-binding transcriptional regulator n=1 Tax=Palleronia sp. LCG004 TaxID=3079304 RepID=UPI002942B2A2|nr:LacI family DNA-binding transcriptional regulator [Palleronia sp. LCG004]WOI58115.1 LacI family DNA-binding transcriptional regulator [Palleronia sp. LCG004]
MSRPFASLQQIADAVGVSTATVSNALRGTGRVSEGVQARVRDAAQRLGYVPSHAARSLRQGRSTNVGLVVPDFSMPLFPAFVRAFEQAARRRGLALMVAESMGNPGDQRAAIRDLESRGVDAVIVIPVRDSDGGPMPSHVPTVTVDAASNPDNAASSDHREGGRMIARHLVELGHQSVLTLVSAAQSCVSAEREGGMREIFEAAGIRLRRIACAPSFDAAFALGVTLDTGDATACAAAYDAQAVGLIAALRARGIDVPGDLSVTGFDDVIWGRIVEPPLTTIAQDLDAVADHALDVATGASAGARLFPVKLVTRGSTAVPTPTPTRNREGSTT